MPIFSQCAFSPIFVPHFPFGTVSPRMGGQLVVPLTPPAHRLPLHQPVCLLPAQRVAPCAHRPPPRVVQAAASSRVPLPPGGGDRWGGGVRDEPGKAAWCRVPPEALRSLLCGPTLHVRHGPPSLLLTGPLQGEGSHRCEVNPWSGGGEEVVWRKQFVPEDNSGSTGGYPCVL